MIPSQPVFDIFKQLNQIPRPSHHEERVADFLCDFAKSHGLEYDRDAHHCVVIRKPAYPGYENAETIVILNHMDMVCVAEPGREFDALNDPIDAYVDGDWMKARGTSLGADNGIGLSMALAILQDKTLVHGPLEVITTTNEEDGMSGAANLSTDFIKGRKVVNLDSEDYDTITTGAAGAYMQTHHLPARRVNAPRRGFKWFKLTIDGGKGGHSGVDINKGRASATTLMWALLSAIADDDIVNLASITVGAASASIAASAQALICVEDGDASERVKMREKHFNEWLADEYGASDPAVSCSITSAEASPTVISPQDVSRFMSALSQIPQGVVRMSESMPGTPETSNNVGMIRTTEDEITVTTHTRSFLMDDMVALGTKIRDIMTKSGGKSELIMSAPAWQENPDSPFLNLTSDVFQDVLGWRPRKVAMHFVLEAGFFVEKYPGIQMASIGPRIIEPHSTGERVQISTINEIWQVTVALLRRLASE